jgi:ATP-dependent DNA helicase RecQ
LNLNYGNTGDEVLLIQSALQILHKYYGYRSFRKDQEDIIKSILNKKDTLAIMPTGGGKSICYQIPALIFQGITIVISPLISLMKDQVDSIRDLGISADYINSLLDKDEIEYIVSKLKKNSIKILYVAPERLESTSFYNTIKNMNISQVAIDEAHCVSQWGHDFRSSYRYIWKFIDSLEKRPVVTAFTATATQEVREDIVKQIKLQDPRVFISGFDRKNLRISCLKIGDRFSHMLKYIKENSKQSGIIYAATRKSVDSIYEKFLKNHINVVRYHAGLSDSERKRAQEDFVYDRVSVIVATNAFGMGIDKSNVRYVIHYNMPRNIESYYQEIGRAGRDGEISDCILLFSPQDVATQKYLIESSVQSESRKLNEYKKLQQMVDFVHYSGCLRKYILNYFGEKVQWEECGNCSNCMNDGEYTDRTIDAQKVMLCVYRIKKGFGVNMIVNVLRGSSQRKIIQNGFHRLSTYGIMREYSKEQLSNFINTLIAHGYLSLKEGEYPVVILNKQSLDVLKGNAKVILKENVKIKKVVVDNELFDILRTLRRDISSKEGIPPYLVFSDSTLREMSMRYPCNKEQMLDISGVGSLKLEKYGDMFIDKIEEYVLKNNIDTNWSFKKEIVRSNDTKKENRKLKTHEITLNMIRENMGVVEVAKKRGLKISTILTHITKCIEKEDISDLNIDFSDIFTEDEEKIIMSAIEKVGFERLYPIKEIVPENIDYDKIKSVILKNYLCNKVS